MAAEDIFNSTDREKNMVRSSMVGALSHVAQLIPTFVGRTLFLRVLAEEYLGLTGLFTNVLLILSLTDLGIATAISYRFYDPVNRKDIRQVGRLMDFFRWVYGAIILAILSIGLGVAPFVKFMIRDAAEIPGDVNIYIVYLLFLADTLSTYLFVYKQTLLSVDQRNDLVCIIQTCVVYAATAAKIALLLITRSYTAYLISGIAMTVTINYLVSLWITRRYKPIFEVREHLPKAEQLQIFSDTKACLLHKVGSTLLTSTDNMVLSKMVGLAATGLYSNYSIITLNLTIVMSKLFGNYVSSIGNAKMNLNTEDHFRMYRRQRFMNWFLAAVTTVCLHTLVTDFVRVWLGDRFALDNLTVAFLCAQYFLSVARVINTSYINACGWFILDKPRPIIEAILNLILAVSLSKYMGMAGVFLGTLIAEAVTVCWREPYILYRHEFRRSQWEYWAEYLSFAVLTAAVCAGIQWSKRALGFGADSWLMWLAEAISAGIVSLILFSLAFCRKDGFRFLLEKVWEFANRFRPKAD